MIFTDEVLFLHVPKTGGMKLTGDFLKNLKGDIRITVPEGHHNAIGEETILAGKRHENLADAQEFFIQNELPHRIETFKAIVVVIRNPYDLLVSRYFYLRKNNPWDQGKAAEIAKTSDFETFATTAPTFFKIKDYLLYNNVVPSNLVVIRFEDFINQINFRLNNFLKSPISNSKENSSKHNHYLEYINNQETESGVYRTFSYLFNKGYYSRLIF